MGTVGSTETLMHWAWGSDRRVRLGQATETACPSARGKSPARMMGLRLTVQRVQLNRSVLYLMGRAQRREHHPFERSELTPKNHFEQTLQLT